MGVYVFFMGVYVFSYVFFSWVSMSFAMSFSFFPLLYHGSGEII
jgi:hypothetical protein